jgi:ribosomal protein S18 acetylase RimI-like enzyme
MNIRIANKFDLPDFLLMVKHFQESTDLPMSIRDANNWEYINKMFHHIILGGGLVLIAESDKTVGMIVGLKNRNIWDPEQFVMQELMLWVEPEYRNTRAGYMLVKEFSKQIKQMVEEKQIMSATMTNTENLVNIDYTRFGFKKFEETWVLGV